LIPGTGKNFPFSQTVSPLSVITTFEKSNLETCTIASVFTGIIVFNLNFGGFVQVA